MIIDELLNGHPFNLCKRDKKEIFQSAINETIQHYLDASPEYRRWCESRGFKGVGNVSVEGIPFVPVQVFKEKDLITVKESEIVDIRHSSSTSYCIPSLIKRDTVTLTRYKQSRNAVLDSFCPNNRKVQIGIIEDPSENPNPHLSANLVLSVIASRTEGQTFYVVKNIHGNPEIDVERFLSLLNTFKNEVSLLFGHTAYIYLFLIESLREKGIKLHLSDVTMLFGWGWKKYSDKAVSMDIFRKSIEETIGIPSWKILDMYGFAESNSLYLECSEGYRHVPVWDEVLVRCPQSFKVLEDGKEGLLQFLSPIPNSYAGASVLVDDIGSAYRESEGCICGRKGTKFKVIRRATREELIAFKNLSDSFTQ